MAATNDKNNKEINMQEPIKVNASAGETAKVKLHGDTYKVTLDDDDRATLTIYGQVHSVEGQPKAKKSKKSTALSKEQADELDTI